MKKIITIGVMLVILISSGFVVSASAQENGTTNAETQTETPTKTQELEETSDKEIDVEISDNVYIEDYKFDEKNKSVTITFNQYDKSVPDIVTVSNFLYEIDGGVKEYISSSYTIQGKTKVTFNLKMIDGQMAVLVSHGNGAEILTYDSQLFNFSNSYTTSETAMFLGFGVVIGITGVTAVALKRKWEISTKVTRRL